MKVLLMWKRNIAYCVNGNLPVWKFWWSMFGCLTSTRSFYCFSSLESRQWNWNVWSSNFKYRRFRLIQWRRSQVCLVLFSLSLTIPKSLLIGINKFSEEFRSTFAANISWWQCACATIICIHLARCLIHVCTAAAVPRSCKRAAESVRLGSKWLAFQLFVSWFDKTRSDMIFFVLRIHKRHSWSWTGLCD